MRNRSIFDSLRITKVIILSCVVIGLTGHGVSAQAKLFDAPSTIFDTGRNYEGANPNSMATGDLDGDGDADAVLGVTLGVPGITVNAK